MNCEKQFLPASSSYLYCSDSCRMHDLPHPTSTTTGRTNSYPSHRHGHAHGYSPTSPPLSPAMRASSGPDILPRFSPTQSRPRSYFNSEPYPQSSTYNEHEVPPFHLSENARSTTALASLRELATALPTTKHSDSPPRSHRTPISRPTSGVWNYIPFTTGGHSKTAAPTPTVTPGNSYSNASQVSMSYGNGGGYRSREDLTGYGPTGAGKGTGMDRPLPPRGGPGGYGHRPRSIDLVTPFSSK